MGRLADGLGRRQAAHVGHVPVGQHHVVGLARFALGPVAGQGGRAGVGLVGLPAPSPDQLADQFPAGAVVVRHQHAQWSQRGCAARPALLRQHLERQREPEARALPGHAADVDLPAHQFDQALADDQPQAGAAEAARDADVALGKGREQLALLLGRDADARVAHFEAQTGRLALALRQRHAHHHLALGRELDGVAGQVDQHLLQPQGVAVQQARHVRLHHDGQLQFLVAGAHGHGGGQRVEDFIELEFGRRQFHAARLDLGEVEHVVEDGQQRLARHAHHGQVFALLRRERRVGQQVDHAQHGIHGGADFMAHVGHEVALGPVGRLGPVPFAFELARARLQLAAQAVLLGDVGDHGQHLGALVRAYGAQVDIDGELGAVLAQAQQLAALAHAHRLVAQADGHELQAVRRVAIPQPGRHQHFQRLADDVGPPVTEAAFGLAVEGFDVAGAIHHDDGVGRQFDQALQAGVGRQPFAHQAVEGRRQLADLVLALHRQRAEMAGVAPQPDDGFVQAQQRRHQVQGEPADQDRTERGGQRAPQGHAVQHAVEGLERFLGRQRGAQYPVDRLQGLEAGQGPHPGAVGGDHRAFVAIAQGARGGRVGIGGTGLEQPLEVGMEHVHGRRTAREGEIVAAAAHLGRAQVAQQVVLVQPQHAHQHACHLAVRIEHGRGHLHDRLLADLAHQRFRDHRFAGTHHLLEEGAVGGAGTGAPRHGRQVGQDGTVRAQHQQVVEQRQHGPLAVIGPQLVRRSGDGGRLQLGRPFHDGQQHQQLVVQFLGRAVDQGRLLVEQHLGEIVAHALRLHHGHQRDHQDRGETGGQGDFGFDAERLHGGPC